MILPFSMIDNADAKTDEKSVKDLLKDVSNEAKEYVKQDEKDKSKDEKKDELKIKYDNKLDKVREKLEEQTGYMLNEEQTSKFNNYVINEIIKRTEIEQAYLSNDIQVTETLEIDGFWNIIPYVQATTNQYPISEFVQPLVDVTGGSGLSGFVYYNVNGDNQLIGVDKIISSSQSMTRYVLEWQDEDDPNPTLDAIYDQYRLQHFGRIADVETFVVLDGQIQFDGIWDQGNGYGISAHGDKTRTWSNGVTIYANTWNHALDIYDNNSGLTKYIRYF